MLTHTTSFIKSGHFSLKTIESQQTVGGDTLLIIGSADYYHRVMPSNLSDHFHCIFVDHRGFAPCSQEVTSEDISLSQVTLDIAKMCDSYGIKKCWVLGHSGHAYMALDFAASYPDLILGIILIGASPNLSNDMQALQFARWNKEASSSRKHTFEQNINQLQSDIDTEPERKFVHLCRRLGAMRWFNAGFDEMPLWEGLITHTPLLDKLWGETFAELDISAYSSSIKSPVLIISGEYDYSIAPLNAWYNISPNFVDVRYQVIKNSAHTPMYEQPETFLNALLSFTHA
ncbi:alpha/beta hydrolase [Vibrio sp. Of7-15]|uniref:alpha/beta fold hydrolase n=1 Tax=Vibrio sp. Of7-15 TaxID=2724879 RepID=UPI001EF2ADA4|nr:alpha/beta hydrolase [Vibrio sp. Of7-15]MCG7496420.1 alpha/beta hydrolase [Vibrio sp. Of7-15]